MLINVGKNSCSVELSMKTALYNLKPGTDKVLTCFVSFAFYVFPTIATCTFNFPGGRVSRLRFPPPLPLPSVSAHGQLDNGNGLQCILHVLNGSYRFLKPSCKECACDKSLESCASYCFISAIFTSSYSYMYEALHT